jgi:LPXTG-motif cell wall-anchored protein
MSNTKTIENHKIKKILTTTAAAGVAITAGAMATTNAHADAVPDANQQSATTQATSSLSDLKAAQKASRQAYAQASSAQSSAQANYNQASNAIQAQSDAQAKLVSDQDPQSQAQANLDQNNELLAKAQSAASANGFDVNSISAAHSTADAAQKTADTASANAASTAAALSNAQKNADQANTDLTNAKQAQTKANQTVTDAQNNVNTAQSNVNAITNQGAAIKNAAQKVSDAQTAKNNADNDVKSKQGIVNTAENQLKQDQAKLDAATQTVPSNGDDSSNGNFRLDDQYNNMYNSYQDRLKQAIENNQGEEQGRIENELDAAILNFMHKWNPQNAKNQYLNDNDKIPASHTLTNLNDSYQSDPDLRRLLVKVGYPDYYTYEPTDPNNLHAPWKKVLGYSGVNRGLSSSASINATNYVLELINPIRQSRGLAPLTTDMNAINKGAEAVKEMVNLPALNWGENSQSALENHYNQEQKIAQKYGFTDYDTDSGNEGWFLHGHQLGQGPEVDENTLPDKGWLSVDNLHRALFEYAQNEAKGQDDGLIGDANFLLQSKAKSIAVQVGQDGNIYVFMFTPTKPSTDTTALQSAIAHDKQALGSAQQDLASAKSAAQQAEMALAKAQATYSQLTNGAKDPATLQKNLATAKSNLAKAQELQTKANQLVAQAQAKVDSTKATLTAAKAANDQAQSKLTQANANLKSATDQLNTLAKGHEALLNAMKAVKDAQHNLDMAEAQVKADQASLDKLTPAAKAAQAKIADLKAALDKANTDLATAKANLITDAKVYGDIVEVNDASMHAKQALPTLSIKNAMADDPTQSMAASAFMSLAELPGDTIPTGTTVAFADPAKATRDSQVPGDYVEDVLVTFPDGSTVTKQIELHVSAAIAGLPAGWKIVNGHVVDANGNIIPGYTVDKDGNVIKLSTAANGVNVAAPTANNKNNSQAAQLPQTGNDNKAGVLALAGTSLATMFGLITIKKHA